jgi:hypothetical protein
MRHPNIALLCLLLSACPPQDHVAPDPTDDGDGSGDRDPTDDGETSGQAACEAAGGSWLACPPNADCTYYCKLPEPEDDGEPDGTDMEDGDDVADGDELPDDDAGPACLDHATQESCDAAGCTWDRCAPNADCEYQCWGQAECEAAGGVWKECPPNADCVHQFWCTVSTWRDPEPGKFACGPEAQCGAAEFCEVVASDIPEFETGYNRYQCRALPPVCEGVSPCSCLEQNATCEVFDFEATGTCSESSGFKTLTCGIGG